jgi:hypothetical protein
MQEERRVAGVSSLTSKFQQELLKSSASGTQTSPASKVRYISTST